MATSPTRSRPRPNPDDGTVLPYAFLLGVLLFLLVGALALWQVTAARPARNVLEAGIVALTGIDTVLAENERELREFARASDQRTFVIPGYPLPVQLTRDEVLELERPELREVVLERSSAIIYRDGLDAFDRTGSQSLNTLSSEGLLEVAVGQLTEDAHGRATLVVSVLAVLAALAALAVAFKANGYRKVTTLGAAALPAGIAGAAFTFAAGWLAGQVAGDDDFARDLREVVDAVVDVPLRDFAVLAGLGLALIVTGVLFSVAARMVPAAGPGPAYGRYDEYSIGDEDEDEVR